MDSFTIEIAGLSVGVQPLFSSTQVYFVRYLTDRSPDFFVDVSSDDLAFEQRILDLEADEEGLRRRKFSDPFLERSIIQRKIALELINRDTLLFHGSTVAVNGFAYLFTAPCGTGKSTHTRLWRDVFGDRAIMINDDKAFLKVTSSGVIAYGSPWSGKHGLDTNVSLPLKGICFLRRGKENRIWLGDSQKLWDEIAHQCLIPDDPEGKTNSLALIDGLLRFVPLWEMECTKDPSAAVLSYNTMSNFSVK